MDLRRDAIAGTAYMIAAVERIATDAAKSGDIVATVGDIEVPEGAINKVCGRTQFLLDIRSNDTQYRDDVESSILEEFETIANERDLEIETQPLGRSNPVDLDGQMLEVLEETAEESGRIPSGGGHDAMNFQHAGIPTSLLFVPSVDGISHNPREETYDDAVRDATEVFVRTLLRGPPDDQR
jgi:acetylornithine deacetylase/succinyl-diaminopimelate desuccinylase-like protein